MILLSPRCLAVLARLGRRGPDRGAAGPARPGPLPGPLGLGARRDQPRRADRRRRLRRCPRRGSGTSSTTPGPTWRRISSSSTRPTGPTARAVRATGRAAAGHREQAAVDGGERARHRRRARLPRRHPARLDERLARSTPRPGAAGPDRCTWPPRSSCGPSGSRPRRSTRRPTSSPCGPGCPRLSKMQLTYGNLGTGQGPPAANGQRHRTPARRATAWPTR